MIPCGTAVVKGGMRGIRKAYNLAEGERLTPGRKNDTLPALVVH
jgi:hypothetical protein